MVIFHDREPELDALKKIREHSFKQSQMVVLYGRRRAGKTELVKKFLGLEGEKGVYVFIGTKSERLVFDDLATALRAPLGVVPRISSWDDFFEIVFKNGLAVVMDEFPNILKVNPAAVSAFQDLWDRHCASPGCMLIIVGSYVSTIKRMFFDEKQPLFGRARYKLNLRPFDFAKTCGFLGSMGVRSARTACEVYAVLGGVPHYLMYLEFTDPDGFVRDLFYDFPAPLAEEGKNILVQEFGTEHIGYFSILESVASGCTTPKLIIDRTGLKPDTVHKYLYELAEVYGILKREYPVGERQNRKSVRYRMGDSFFDFWFRCVYPDRKGLTDEEFAAYVGVAFERIVTELIPQRYPEFKECGGWWSKGEEIDVVGIDRKGGEILFCECKWQNRKVAWPEVDGLMRKSGMVSWRKGRRKERFLVVAREGFTEDCMAKMTGAGIQHWTLADIALMVGLQQ